ncbi:MAG: hypothetical protein ABL901_18280 [Hyphomicrobiaceae bacterium]
MPVTTSRSTPARAVLSLVATFALLILELVLTMLVYSGLNIYSLNLFGMLVRGARSVLDLMTALVERIIPGSANTAYATLFGELGPKSILLLLIGLLVSAIVRSVVGAISSRR